MSRGIHTHPYKRGFCLGIEREGWLRLYVLLWKWEAWVHIHPRTGP